MIQVVFVGFELLPLIDMATDMAGGFIGFKIPHVGHSGGKVGT